MTKAVWKYPVPVTDYFTIYMPREAKPLAVMMQQGEPHLWALVDPPLAAVERYFRVAGTGHFVDDQIIAHVGSFQLSGGALVFHVFEIEAP